MRQPSPALSARLRACTFATCDPGTGHPAAAVFRNGELVAASRVKIPYKLARMTDDFTAAERARQIGALVYQWILVAARDERPKAFVQEWMKAYQRGQSKNSADQLFHLIAIGESVATRLDVETISPVPFEWIGNIPKDDEAADELAWETPRGKFLKGRMTPAEVARVALSHDAVDATGLGLWALGRLERRFPGAV